MHMLLFRCISVIFGVMPLLLVLLATCGVRRHPAWPSVLTRSRLLGVLIGVPVLCWCAYEGALMLPAAYKPAVWALVPIIAALCTWLMDFVPARAFGGLVALLANFLIQHAFAYNCMLRSVFCVTVLLAGIAGTICIAWPWMLRNALNWMAGHQRQDRLFIVIGVIFAVVLILLPLCGG